MIYHLVENKIFQKYLRYVFHSSSKYVIIYASNFEQKQSGDVKHRKFTNWIENNIKNFKLINKILNKYPYEKSNPNNTSLADFFIYQKVSERKESISFDL